MSNNKMEQSNPLDQLRSDLKKMDARKQLDVQVEKDTVIQEVRAIPENIYDVPLAKLSKDIKMAVTTLTNQEARFLVDQYYSMQKQRISNGLRAGALSKTGEPNLVFDHLGENFQLLEDRVKKALEEFAKSRYIGRWMMSVRGIGPVISAGIIAYIGDIRDAPTAGHLWAYAGLDPKKKWIGAAAAERIVKDAYQEVGGDLAEVARLVAEQTGASFERFLEQATREGNGKLTRTSIVKVGSRRPWNASFKKLMWLVSESFIKQPADKCMYRRLYDERKRYEQEINVSGGYAEQAKRLLSEKNYDKTTETYKAMIQGRLSDGHIHARCKRYAAKIFLAHVHEVYWEHATGTEAPPPYILAYGESADGLKQHVHKIDPPDFIDNPKDVVKYGKV